MRRSGHLSSVHCQNCRHCEWGYLTTLDGQGVYAFAYCSLDIVNPVVVDAKADRVCRDHQALAPRIQ